MRSKLAALIALVVWLGPLAPAWSQETALDRYVAKPDGHFATTVVDASNRGLYTTTSLIMTSQQWRSPAEVEPSVWQHQMLITIPQLGPPKTTAILLIDGGNDGDTTFSSQTTDLMAALALIANSVTAVVRQVPNQPLAFTDEGGATRSEDAILAYSFDKYLTTGDEEWPVHLAMTKAAVRAMDTVQQVAASQGDTVNDFIVIGASKRGWTAWLTTAVDGRVKAVIPISIDMLNLGVQFRHHWEAYGFYAPAISEYVDFDLPCRTETAQGQDLLDIVDPYQYRNRLTMPKLLVNSSGDQFFLPDSSQFYFADLLPPRSLRYTFNTDHGQGNIQDLALEGYLWIRDVNDNKPAPQYSWSLEGDGSIRVQTVTAPRHVYLWQATNPTARDFRLQTIGPAWTRSELQDTGGGVYVGFVPPPPAGFTAFAAELVFQENVVLGAFNVNQSLTTDVRITPDILPFRGTQCGAPSPVPRLRSDIGFLHVPVVSIPGAGNFNIMLQLADPSSLALTLQTYMTTPLSADFPGTFSADSGVLHLPVVEVTGLTQRFAADFILVPGTNPPRFTFTQATALPMSVATLSLATGTVTLPAVDVEGAGFFSYELAVAGDGSPTLVVQTSTPIAAQAVSPATLAEDTGKLVIPIVEVTETGDRFQVQLATVPGTERTRFTLESATLLP